MKLLRYCYGYHYYQIIQMYGFCYIKLVRLTTSIANLQVNPIKSHHFYSIGTCDQYYGCYSGHVSCTWRKMTLLRSAFKSRDFLFASVVAFSPRTYTLCRSIYLGIHLQCNTYPPLNISSWFYIDLHTILSKCSSLDWDWNLYCICSKVLI